MKPKQGQGFTLIELVVVIAIMTLLLGIAAPSITGLMNSQRASAVQVELEALAEAAKMFCEDTLERPGDIDSLYSSPVSGFGGPYIDDLLGGRDVAGEGFRHDPWGRPYIFETEGDTRIIFSSSGLDGKINTSDDIVRELDLRAILRRHSIARLEILNQAVASYNKTYITTKPLPTSAAAAVSALVADNYLPATGEYSRDAFGDLFVATGSPVVQFQSANFGTEGTSSTTDPFDSSSSSGGSKKSGSKKSKGGSKKNKGGP